MTEHERLKEIIDLIQYNGRFYILNGDLRKECEKCKDIEEVREKFLKSDLPISSRSNDFASI